MIDPTVPRKVANLQAEILYALEQGKIQKAWILHAQVGALLRAALDAPLAAENKYPREEWAKLAYLKYKIQENRHA
jgi:hypothetical protein